MAYQKPKGKHPIKWEEADFKWDLAPTNSDDPRYTWDDVQLVIEAIGGGGDMDEMPWTQWEDEEKKNLVNLICKVQGKTIIKEKFIKDYKITVSDIKLLAEKVLGIEVITENIKF